MPQEEQCPDPSHDNHRRTGTKAQHQRRCAASAQKAATAATACILLWLDTSRTPHSRIGRRTHPNAGVERRGHAVTSHHLRLLRAPQNAFAAPTAATAAARIHPDDFVLTTRKLLVGFLWLAPVRAGSILAMGRDGLVPAKATNNFRICRCFLRIQGKLHKLKGGEI